MRPDIRRQVEEETEEHRATAQARRERVLAHPDIAELLTHPPLSLPSPLFWSGFVPLKYHQDRYNDSPVRQQLLAILNMVLKREEEIAAGGRPAIAPELVTEKTLQIMHIHFDEFGIRDRDEKLQYLAAELDRPKIESSKELSEAEALAITNKLRQLIKLDQHADALQGISEVTGETHDLTAEDQARPGRRTPDPVDGDDGPTYPGEEPIAEFNDGSAEDIPPY